MNSDLVIGITIVILWVPSLYLIPKYLGTKRQIGWKYSLFFTIFLTWIGGLILTLFSRPIQKSRRVGLNKIMGILGIVASLNSLYTMNNEKNYSSNFFAFITIVVLQDNLNTNSFLLQENQ
jgi:hypothetical protein